MAVRAQYRTTRERIEVTARANAIPRTMWTVVVMMSNRNELSSELATWGRGPGPGSCCSPTQFGARHQVPLEERYDDHPDQRDPDERQVQRQ